jgi:hypothetical protein
MFMNNFGQPRCVRYVAGGSGGTISSATHSNGLTGEVVIGFTGNLSAATRPIDNAGVTVFTGATSPSATSGCDGGWFIAPSDAISVTCSGGTATMFQIHGFGCARSVKGGAKSVVTSATVTIPAIKGWKVGGRVWVQTFTETAGRTVSSDDLGLGAVNSTNNSGLTRNRWIGPSTLSSYPGGSVTFNGSSEFWAVYGIAW